jgi:hypothetical protein
MSGQTAEMSGNEIFSIWRRKTREEKKGTGRHVCFKLNTLEDKLIKIEWNSMNVSSE